MTLAAQFASTPRFFESAHDSLQERSTRASALTQYGKLDYTPQIATVVRANMKVAPSSEASVDTLAEAWY